MDGKLFIIKVYSNISLYSFSQGSAILNSIFNISIYISGDEILA